jgi:peptide/nickel transport system substrate-binding protein
MAALALACQSGAALAQKSGGILKVYHRDNPPSASILEEATNSTVIPFMPLFNNLVLYDQQVARTARADRARPREVMGLEWRRQGHHLQAAGRREVATAPFTARTWSAPLTS